MTKPRLTVHLLAVSILLVAGVAVASAQATRTWVSGTGSDANPCSRTAPCQTFAGAISKTASGGEIDTLDNGSFGTVTINKPITIDGSGGFTGILASGVSGITVNIASPAGDDNVILRGLRINGNNATGTGSGIRYLSANSLVVEDCKIFNFPNFGIDVTESAGHFLAVRNTAIQNCVNGGINVTTTSGTMRALIEDSTVFGCTFGYKAGANSMVAVNRSSASGCGNAGFLADGTGVTMNVKECVTTNNANGIRADNLAIIRISHSQVVNNITNGYFRNGNGVIESYANNEVRGNPTNSSAVQVGPS